MTYAHTMEGKVLHFPPSLATNRAGVIEAPQKRELLRIAGAVRSEELLGFARTLARAARRRHGSARWAAVNAARIELARICADRIVAEDLPGDVDRAIGELRWGPRAC